MGFKYLIGTKYKAPMSVLLFEFKTDNVITFYLALIQLVTYTIILLKSVCLSVGVSKLKVGILARSSQ